MFDVNRMMMDDVQMRNLQIFGDAKSALGGQKVSRDCRRRGMMSPWHDGASKGSLDKRSWNFRCENRSKIKMVKGNEE